MTTTLYLHTASNSIGGSFPAVQQSTLELDGNFDALSLNRTMDTIVGTLQTTLTNNLTSVPNGVTVPYQLYVARFVSPPLNQTSIAANTWTTGTAGWATSATPYWPDGGGNMISALYVWRPSTGAKIATIWDKPAVSSTISAHISSTTEKTIITNFTGSAAASVAIGDVIIFEQWGRCNALNQTYSMAFDGTSTITTDNTAVSSYGSFIQTPETISFDPRIINATATTKTVTNKFIRKI